MAEEKRTRNFGDKRDAAAHQEEWFEKVIAINRVSKVVKGGKRMSFSALIVVGDKKGNVGYGFGKANEVAEAIRKGLNSAKKSITKVCLVGTTIPYEVTGIYGAGRVLLKPAGEGTGIIAGGPVRAVCEAAGIKDVLSKCLNSNNPINVIKATMNGLTKLRAKSDILNSRSSEQVLE